jgi:hypothetical protein
MKKAELAVHRRTIVENLLSGQLVLFVEAIHRAKRKAKLTAGARQSAKRASVSSTDLDFEDDVIFSYVASLHVNVEIRCGTELSIVKRSDCSEAFMMHPTACRHSGRRD